MNFIRKNWFKLSLIFCALVVAVSFAAYYLQYVSQEQKLTLEKQSNSTSVSSTTNERSPGQDSQNILLEQKLRDAETQYQSCLIAAQRNYDSWASGDGMVTVELYKIQQDKLQSEKQDCEAHYRDTISFIGKEY